VDLRLVEYTAYLALSIPLTLWVGRTLPRAALLVGLGGVALLLQAGGGAATAADVLRVIVTKLGVVLLLLGALHLCSQAVQQRVRREPVSPAREAPTYEPLRPASGRFPY
jgi:hypothetical protein